MKLYRIKILKYQDTSTVRDVKFDKGNEMSETVNTEIRDDMKSGTNTKRM